MPANGDWSILLEQRPELLTVLLALIAALGLVLCLLGRRLTRSLCTLVGVAGGGGAAYALARGTVGQEMLFVWIIAGAVAGLLLGWFLFRAWMGVTLALMLSVAASTVALVVQDNLPPLVPESARNLWQEVAGPIADGQAVDDDQDDVEAELPQLRQVPQLLTEPLAERLQPVLVDEGKALVDWWRQSSATGRLILIIAAGVGGLIGLIVGLLGPQFTAALISSLMGAVLIVGGVGFMNISQIEAVLPPTALARIVAVSLITIAGTLLQWTVLRKKTDKQ